MDGTILGQGSFIANSTGLANPNPGNATVSNAIAAYVPIPSNADWMRVRNFTREGVAGVDTAYFNGSNTAFVGTEFYWQRGYAPGSMSVKYYADGGAEITGDITTSGGFTLYDPSGQSQGAQPLLGNPVAITASTNATRPVLTTGNTAGVSVGTVIRVSGSEQTDVNGVDFVVGAVVANTSITLMAASNALANVPGIVGTTGFYRIVYNGNSELFYPRSRYVTNITRAVNAQVSTSVAHGLTPGQTVRFKVSNAAGMIQLNPQASNGYFPLGSSTNAAVVTVVDDFNFTINIDTTAYTPFAYPTAAQVAGGAQVPEMTPFGENTALALASNTAQVPSIAGVQIYNTNTGILADSTVNTGFLGMILGTGGTGAIAAAPIIGPAGSLAWSAGNVATGSTMYWVAGKSTYGGL